LRSLDEAAYDRSTEMIAALARSPKSFSPSASSPVGQQHKDAAQDSPEISSTSNSNRPCMEVVKELIFGKSAAQDGNQDRLVPLREAFQTTVIEDNTKVITKADLLAAEEHGAKKKPQLFVLCRRSDETLPVDGLYEPNEDFAAALSLGGRAMFVQPTKRAGLMHILSDRLPRPPASPVEDSPAFKAALTELLAHEGSHAVDALTHGFDLAMVGHLACSEVRAAYFGECHESSFDWTKRRCSRKLASDSTELAFPGLGSEAVNAVFDWCYSTRLSENAVANSPLRDLKPIPPEEAGLMAPGARQGGPVTKAALR
jgi:Peptidase M76 family